MGRVSLKPYTAVFPCPVILVSCADGEGNPNIITLAWAGNVCSDPPMAGISIRPQRHSHRLIRETGEFVINIPGENIIQAVDTCGITSGAKINKFEECGFTAGRGKVVGAPIIKECPVNIECVLKDIVNLGVHDLFLGEIVEVQVDENFMSPDGNYPDYEKIKPFTYCPQKYLSTGKEIGFYGFTKKKS